MGSSLIIGPEGRILSGVQECVKINTEGKTLNLV
jgi:hypothetical protein